MRKEMILRGLALLGVSLLLLIMGIWQGSMPIIATVVGSVAVVMVSALLAYLVRKRVDVTIDSELAAKKGESHQITVRVTNRSPLPLSKVWVQITIRNNLTGEATDQVLAFSVGAHADATATVDVSSQHCGFITAEVGSLLLSDLFGVIPIPFNLNYLAGSGLHVAYSVLPAVAVVPDVEVTPQLAPEDSDRYSAVSRGNDASEIFQIREYAPGDSVKHIHWKLTSKIDVPVVRDASLPITNSLLVVWDKNVSGKEPTPAVIDAVAEVFSSVCVGIAESGFGFGLAVPISGGAVEMYDVNSVDTVIGLIPQLIKKGYSEHVPSLDAITQTARNGDYGSVVCFTHEPSPSLAEISAEIPTTAFVCGAVDAQMGNLVIKGFDPDSYMESLTKVTVGT